MGGAVRYPKQEIAEYPGPGYYKILGFTDILLREIEKHRVAKGKAVDSKNIEALSKQGMDLDKMMNMMDDFEHMNHNEMMEVEESMLEN
jgi:hypothetical protein